MREKKKNTMRSPEEKERIVLEALERGAANAANAHAVHRRVLQKWMAKYSAGGIDSLRSQTRKCGKGNPLVGLQRKKNKSREEELELEVLKLKIEVERLKKGTG